VLKKVVSLFVLREDHSSSKALEVQLDCFEFLLSALPECLLPELGPICLVLLGLTQKQRRKEIVVKA
jgi:hypothetical protein